MSNNTEGVVTRKLLNIVPRRSLSPGLKVWDWVLSIIGATNRHFCSYYSLDIVGQ